jgi:hypothetical protein
MMNRHLPPIPHPNVRDAPHGIPRWGVMAADDAEKFATEVEGHFLNREAVIPIAPPNRQYYQTINIKKFFGN